MKQEQVILRIDGVTKQFDQPPPAVANVSLSLVQGDLLGLLGPSGCGKTTLLRLIAGFERPQSGRIEIAGKTVAGANWIPPEQRSVGMVFQDYALFPHLTVGENVAFGLRYSKKSSDRVAQLIELVGLAGLEKRYPHELSGGQQQRVALARALAPEPALILLDEPLSNLDVQVRLRLREELREILKATGISGVFVTHDQEEALAIADRVAVMRQGKIEQLGTPEDVYSHPQTRFVAEFVTRANFLPAKRRGHLWETEIGCFTVRKEMGQSEVADLMIREEDLILQPADSAPIIIHTRRFLGREYRYCLQTASGKRLHARTSAEVILPVGTRVELAVAEQAIRFFPANTTSDNLVMNSVGSH
ncbi:ABC transporter ATP-binding protein [Chroococcidiopsis sp. TS-821]|uniref:ABC transporter ATP-binding protein n=1 Tax=Chroococcidiopsis sp. TS-821 TaxID=1378066 RepID=UPI000CEEA457|nr:ABC transporter ATP-binding protein [Chroococcidiopsis sp. TS-821]PPS41511.1 ABC transporter ATP-binding protein [Chroococcidiopsis sp. TS-821]